MFVVFKGPLCHMNSALDIKVSYSTYFGTFWTLMFPSHTASCISLLEIPVATAWIRIWET